MNSSDSELLRRFVDDGAEDAFTELVRRHLDLVFSAALRQVGPDTQAAEDVALKVFADLARKSSDLVAHPTLTGWLFGSTRLAAMEYRRFESRRIARETRAHAMSQLLSDADAAEPDWNRVRPVLDEAILELNDDDREAVLLRYFEKRPLAEIGSRLGLSENTARMRVDRALDKLHAALARRGITSATGALAAALGANAVSAAPAGMVERIGRKASGSRPVTGGRVFAGKGLGIPGGWMAVLTAVFLAGIGALLWTNGAHTGARTDSTTNATDAEQAQAPKTVGARESGNDGVGRDDQNAPEKGAGLKVMEELILKVVSKESDAPVPGVIVLYTYGFPDLNNKDHSEKAVAACDSNGVARISLPPRSFMFLAQTHAEGYATTKLHLTATEDKPIPSHYTLRLDRAPVIGGLVVDPDGKPVAGASVVVGNTTRAPDVLPTAEFVRPETPSSNPTTGPDGRWKLQTVDESLLSQLVIIATHAEYQNSESLNIGARPELLKSLREQTHVLHLKRAGVIRGLVVDESGRPLEGATVSAGTLFGNMNRQAKTAPNGHFEIRGVLLGDVPVTAEAEGYAAKTIMVTISENIKTLRLILDAGSVLRMRVLNRLGLPIAGAHVRSDPSRCLSSNTVPTQTLFAGHTDEDGRLEWVHAPAGTHAFTLRAKDYMEQDQIEVPADGFEHVVQLRQFYVRGTITDAATGKIIPKVNFSLGWPEIDLYQGYTNSVFPRLSSELRARGLTVDGRYGLLLEEKTWSKALFPGCVLKFEADGYQPYISRPIRYDEEDVVLDVALEKNFDFEATFLGPDGRPVPDADIGVIEPGAEFKLRQGRLFAEQNAWSVGVRRTDSEGKLKMIGNPRATHLVAAHETGYLAAGLANSGNNPVFQLQPWSRIEGTLRATAGSATGRVVMVSQRDLPETALFIADETPVDPDGRFVFQKVPPGRLLVRQMSRMRSSSSSYFNTVARSVETTVAPGETETVTIGGGYTVTGRWLLPAGTTVPEGGFMGAALYIPEPVPAAEITNDPQAMRRWRSSPEIQAQELQAVTLGADLRNDGSFVVDTVSPGNYRLKFSIYPPRSTFAGGPPRMPITFTREVVIPEQPGEGRIDLGDIPFEAPDR